MGGFAGGIFDVFPEPEPLRQGTLNTSGHFEHAPAVDGDYSTRLAVFGRSFLVLSFVAPLRRLLITNLLRAGHWSASRAVYSQDIPTGYRVLLMWSWQRVFEGSAAMIRPREGKLLGPFNLACRGRLRAVWLSHRDRYSDQQRRQNPRHRNSLLELPGSQPTRPEAVSAFRRGGHGNIRGRAGRIWWA